MDTQGLSLEPQGFIEPGLSQLQEQAMRCGLLMEDPGIPPRGVSIEKWGGFFNMYIHSQL